jgi:undecaprenyl-diphosphatase
VWIGLALAGSAVAASYLFADQAVGSWFLAHPSTWHTNPWVNGLRQLGKADVPIWLLVVWGCLTDKWRVTIVTIVALIMVSLCVCSLKVAVGRARPYQSSPSSAAQEREIPWSKRVSFPSGDTGVAFATATTLSQSLHRAWTPPLFAAAAVVGILRVTASQHYPSDVLAGAAIGVFCGLLALQWAPRRWPLDRFQVPGCWRLVAGLLLVLVLPFAGPFLGMRSLQIFAKVYLLPLALLVLIGLATVRLKARASTRFRGDDPAQG